MTLSQENSIEKEKWAWYDEVWNEQNHLVIRVGLEKWE